MLSLFNSGSAVVLLLPLTSAWSSTWQPWAPSDTAPIANTTNGTVQGRYLAEFDQDLFLGIKFAEAPRLDNPRPVNSTWTNFDASEYGTTCYGLGSNPLLNLTQGEDCLNLNIIRPHGYGGNKTNDVEPLPVLLWIYGDGWTQGSSADPMWNLSYIVQTSVENGQPLMAVSINYRLAFLGFPGGNATLSAGIANLGLKDQRIALQWVQENIAAFGGDPEKVAVWGESAGASSIAWQLISYGGTGSQGLFRAAIMASGVEFGTSSPAFTYDLEKQYDAIVNYTNCTDASDQIACLRTAPIEALYSIESKLTGLKPVIDGDFIRREPVLELDAGNVGRVPIIAGNNNDEGLFAVNLLGPPPNVTAMVEVIHAFLYGLHNDTINALLEAYPQDGPAPPYSLPSDYPFCQAMAAANLTCTPEYRRTAAIFGDYFAHAGRRYMVEQWSKLGLPTYSFLFAADPTSIPIQYFNGLGPGFADHGAELAYSFRLPANFTTPIRFYPPVKPVPGHEYLSRVMASKIISFATTLDPNSYSLPDVPVWPQYDTTSPQNFVYNASDAAIDIQVLPDTYREAAINIWNTHIFQAFYNENGPHVGSLG